MLLKDTLYKKHKYITYLLLLILPSLPFWAGAKGVWVAHLFLLIVIIFEKKTVTIINNKWILLVFLPVLWSFYLSLNHETYYIQQSLFYLLTPYVMLVLGIQLNSVFKDKEGFLKYIVYHGTVGSVLFLLIGFISLGVAIFGDIYQLRYTVLWGSITNVITIIILLFRKEHKFEIINSKFWFNFILFVNIIALILTASRTYYLIFLLFLLIVLFKYKKSLFVTTLGIMGTLSVFILSLNSDNLFIIKIQNSFNEISNTKQFSGIDEINAYYRAYETQQAMKSFYSGTDFEQLFGYGLQKLVDLNVYMELAGGTWRFIPIIHNGYPYLLLHVGFVGLFFYLIFFIRMFFQNNDNKEFKFFNVISNGAILSLIVANYVVSAFFTSEMIMGWIIIGAVIAINFKRQNN